MDKRILVINPGSTSTKLALFRASKSCLTPPCATAKRT